MHEYNIIAAYYGKRVARRSQVPLIHHIREGLLILEAIGAIEEAKRAFCLHPIFQADDDLLLHYGKGWQEIDPKVLILVMEYRSVANAYLSHRKISSIEEIWLSPLKAVNDMLIADKVQNRKDFERYHQGSHPRTEELAVYFGNWLARLGVAEEMYQRLCGRLEAA